MYFLHFHINTVLNNFIIFFSAESKLSSNFPKFLTVLMCLHRCIVSSFNGWSYFQTVLAQRVGKAYKFRKSDLDAVYFDSTFANHLVASLNWNLIPDFAKAREQVHS